MFKLVLKSSINNKMVYIYIILFLFLFFLFAVFFNEYYKYYNFINEELGENYFNRMYLVENSNIEKLESYIYKNNMIDKYDEMFKNETIYFGKDLLSINYASLKVALEDGRNIEQSNEIIISKYVLDRLGLTLNDFSNKEINLSIDGKNSEFLIVGITSDNESDIYLEKQVFLNSFNPKINGFYILISDYKYTSKFYQELESFNSIVELINADGLEEINEAQEILNIYKVIYITFLILFLILVILFVSMFFKNEINFIFLLKVIGYNSQKILNYFYLKLIFVFISSLVFLDLSLILFLDIFSLILVNEILFISFIFSFIILGLVFNRKIKNIF